MTRNLLLIVALFTLFSCSNKDDEIPFEPQKNVLDDVEINFYSIYKPGDSVTTSLPFDEGVIKLYLISHMEDLSQHSPFEWSLINSAFATSPVPPQYVEKGIYSLYAEDTLFIAGQKLNPNTNVIEYFRVAFEDKEIDGPVFPDEFDNLMLKMPPDSAVNALFYLIFEMENGQQFTSNRTRVLVNSK